MAVENRQNFPSEPDRDPNEQTEHAIGLYVLEALLDAVEEQGIKIGEEDLDDLEKTLLEPKSRREYLDFVKRFCESKGLKFDTEGLLRTAESNTPRILDEHYTEAERIRKMLLKTVEPYKKDEK